MLVHCYYIDIYHLSPSVNLFSRTARLSRYQNATILDLITGAWMMKVMVTTGAIRNAKLQANCHHQQTNTLHNK